MSIQQKIEADHYLLTVYHLALANASILKRENAEGALENYYARQENKLPLCLIGSKPNDPPPANWRAMWRHHGFRR